MKDLFQVTVPIALVAAASSGMSDAQPSSHVREGHRHLSGETARSVWVIVSVNGREKGRSLTGDDGKAYIAGVDPGTYDFVVVEKGVQLYKGCDAAHRERHVRHHVLSSLPAAWSQPLRPSRKRVVQNWPYHACRRRSISGRCRYRRPDVFSQSGASGPRIAACCRERRLARHFLEDHVSHVACRVDDDSGSSGHLEKIAAVLCLHVCVTSATMSNRIRPSGVARRATRTDCTVAGGAWTMPLGSLAPGATS